MINMRSTLSLNGFSDSTSGSDRHYAITCSRSHAVREVLGEAVNVLKQVVSGRRWVPVLTVQ